MKKYLFAVIVIILAFSALQLRSSAQASDSGPLFSFRGVLYGILHEIKEEAESIGSAVRNPFSETAASPTAQTSDENSFSFAVMGDTQNFKASNPNDYFQKVVGDIAKINPDLVIATGDLTGTCESYTECLEKHNAWKKIDAPLLAKTYAAMGNHDNVGNKGVKAWQDVFNFPTNGPADLSEAAYSFDFKNSHFVFLASDAPGQHRINEEQRSWLDQDLASNEKENTFIVFHEPAFPVSSKIDESLDAQKSDRDALWSILDKHNVTAVFNGHEHIVSRRKIDSSVSPGAKNSIYQFVVGNTDSFNHDLPEPGIAEYANQGQGRFGIVSVQGKEITVKIFSSDSQELNSFTFSK
ncbi:MAG TPA: metallophosphoesterase [Candidatus Bathyarchaeia archaeon]|nr:metallophosphoesterase [Candidatus Bathyarchaeia archaeon]